jgi:general stress protein 26
MDQHVLSFLSNHRVSVLTTLLADGSPHAAALHYSHISDPLTLYFTSKRTSRKMQALVSGNVVKAALVIGMSDEEWKTLQMEGEVKLVSQEEIERIQDIHYRKHPNAQEFKNKPETVFLQFTPTWWRYTDFSTEPLTSFSSE